MAARSAGGSTRASEPEGVGVHVDLPRRRRRGRSPRVWARPRWRLFGEQHDRVPHVSDDGIDDAWRRQLLSAPRTWDAPKFRLASVLVTSTAGGTTAGGGGRLDRRDGRAAPAVLLRVGSTSYREHVGTCTSSRDAAVAALGRTARDFRLGVRAPQRRAGRGSGARDQRWGSCSPAPRRGGRGERREFGARAGHRARARRPALEAHAPEDNRRRSARRELPSRERFFENVFENVR